MNAAGNRAQQHWSGTFVDSNAQRLERVRSGRRREHDRGAKRSDPCAALKWDDWPASAEDYDLYLTRSRGRRCRLRIDRPQTGLEPPSELACLLNTSARTETYAIGIRANRVSARPVRFDLFVYPGPDLEYQVAEGSVTEPGTSPSALTVGAVCWQGQRARALQLRGADHRRSREAGPRRPRLCLVVHVRPVLGLRHKRVRGNLGRNAARRRCGRARQGGESRLRPGRVAGLPRGGRGRPRRARQGLGLRKRAAAAGRRAATRPAPMCRPGRGRTSPRPSRATGSARRLPRRHGAPGAVARSRRPRCDPTPSGRNTPGGPRARQPDRSASLTNRATRTGPVGKTR